MMIIRKEIARFLIAGVLINAIDFGVYYLLLHFFPYGLSKAVSFTCAGVVGYLLSKFLIFRHNQPSAGEIGRYVLINFLALGLNVLLNQSVLSVWRGSFSLAWIVATLSTGLFTFVCFKWWVFRVVKRVVVP